MLAKQIICWDKHHVTRSMKELRKCLDFSDSEILKDLCNLYYCRTVTNASRCYLVELDNVKISVISSDSINESEVYNKFDDIDKLQIF